VSWIHGSGSSCLMVLQEFEVLGKCRCPARRGRRHADPAAGGAGTRWKQVDTGRIKLEPGYLPFCNSACRTTYTKAANLDMTTRADFHSMSKDDTSSRILGTQKPAGRQLRSSCKRPRDLASNLVLSCPSE